VFIIKEMLNYFELAFGLKVNFTKSKIGGVGADQFMLLSFAAILNCDVMKTPFIYLGILVGGVIRRVLFGMVWSTKLRLD